MISFQLYQTKTGNDISDKEHRQSNTSRQLHVDCWKCHCCKDHATDDMFSIIRFSDVNDTHSYMIKTITFW